MIKHCIILLVIAFIPLDLMAQENCVDFESFVVALNWVKEVNQLDAESRKDSILNRIKCKRFFNEENIDVIFAVNGLIINNVPEYRDDLLRQIKAERFWLQHNGFFVSKPPFERCGFLGGMALFHEPIIDNIDALQILSIQGGNWNLPKDGNVRIRLRTRKSQEFTIKIEDFFNREDYTIQKLFLRRIMGTVSLDISREIGKTKVITITDSANNEIVIII